MRKEDVVIYAGPIMAVAIGLALYFAGFPLDRTIVILGVVAIFPSSLARYFKWKKIRETGRRFPNFLKDLSELVGGGTPLYEAVRATSKKDYGELTKHVQQMSKEISLGLSFEESFRRFADRVKVPQIRRAVSLILKANKAGGQVDEVMKVIASRVVRVNEYEKKRRANMLSHTVIVYVAFFSFLGVVYALATVFLPAIMKAQSATGASGFVGGFPKEQFYNVLFYLAVAQGAGAGVLAGKLGEGEITAGLKHSVVLVVIAYIFFFVI